MMFKYCLSMLLIVCLISCKTINPPIENTSIESKKNIKEILRDTIFSTKKDSSFYFAYIKCINNNPILVSQEENKKSNFYYNSEIPKEISGEILKPPRVHLENNILSVSCKAKAQKLFVKWKEQHIQEQISKIKTITLPAKIIEKQLSWWQKLWIAIGKISIVIISVWLLTKISWKSLFGLLIRFLKRL